MTVATRPHAFPVVALGTKLLGEVITWDCSGIIVRHLELIDALSASGLDESVARELAVGSSRVDLQACKLEYSIVSPK